jgi:UDP-glucose 4-epimerase
MRRVSRRVGTVLVTGGCGYIGSHVVHRLVESGASVHVLDDLSNGRPERLPVEASLTIGSITRRADVERAFLDAQRATGRSVSAVMHLAALKSARADESALSRYQAVNVGGTKTLLRTMREHRVRQLVFSSTAAVYAPLSSGTACVRETSRLAPASIYGRTKLACESLICAAEGSWGLRNFKFRYFNAAGHAEDDRFPAWERPAQNLLTIVLDVASGDRRSFELYGGDFPTRDGTSERDFVHVEDIADAHGRALDELGRGHPGATLNLGSSRAHSVLEVLNLCRRITGRPIPMVCGERRSGESPWMRADASVARKMLGWSPTRSALDRIIASSWRARLKSADADAQTSRRAERVHSTG